jgi:hypothetical protein
MHSLKFTRSTFATESVPTKMIFDACRGNEDRGYVYLDHGYKVEFYPRHADEYKAVVTDALGREVASAVVDKFDC